MIVCYACLMEIGTKGECMIKLGDQIPNVTLKKIGAKGPEDFSVKEAFEGKKVVVFAVPGAFTPTCSSVHLPGFVVKADEIKSKGIDDIACVSVNDAFVVGAWAEAQNAENILMLADGNGDLTKALGLDFDASGFGMGLRSKRYVMIVDDLVVTHLAVDEKGLDKSSADCLLDVIS